MEKWKERDVDFEKFRISCNFYFLRIRKKITEPQKVFPLSVQALLKLF